MASDDPVLVKQHDRISVIRLNRPAAMNAVDPALRAMLTNMLARLDADDAVDLVESTLADGLGRPTAMCRALHGVDRPVVAALAANRNT